MGRTMICIALLTFVLLRTSSGDPALCSYQGEEFKTIPENIAVGSVVEVYNINGTNSEIILAQTENNYFSLDIESRNITLEQELDADSEENTIDFTVLCTPRGESIQVRGSISFIVTDVNDNAPIFSQLTYNTDVKEDVDVGTTVFSEVKASDYDTGENGRVYYKILPGEYSDHFQLNSDTESFIILEKVLDYEVVTSITLEILAENVPLGNSISATATVIFNILDVNDNGPVFSNTSYSATIMENANVGSVLQVNQAINAEDQDVTKSAIRYVIVDGDGFEINDTTGEMKVAAPLSVGMITIVIMAQEIDNTEKTAWAVLHINVVGMHVPVFEPSNYNVIVSEMEPIGAILVTVKANDDDKVTYGLRMPSTTFEIDIKHGTIHLLESLDFEKITEYNLEVTASDGVYTATATVKITVINSNDNKPEVDINQVEVNISRSVGTVVHTIHATDADHGTMLSYTIIPSTTLFSVDSNGMVTVSGLEGELTESIYNLLVKVSDDGTPPRETSVWIKIIMPPIPIPPRPSSTRPITQRPTSHPSTDPDEVTPAAVTSADTSDMIVIVLGTVAAVLLLVIVVLVIFIKYRHNRYKDQFDETKLTEGTDPKGLVFKRSAFPQNTPSAHMNFGYNLQTEHDYHNMAQNAMETAMPLDTEERSDDGTTNHDSQLSLNGDTAHNNHDDNDETPDDYKQADEELPIITVLPPLEEDSVNTSLQNDRSPDIDSSGSSDSTDGSKKDLWPIPTKKILRFKNPSSESIPSTRMAWQDSEEPANGELKSDTNKKPEMTVYF